jgi:hypothetical protein
MQSAPANAQRLRLFEKKKRKKIFIIFKLVNSSVPPSLAGI